MLTAQQWLALTLTWTALAAFAVVVYALLSWLLDDLRGEGRESWAFRLGLRGER